MRPSLNKPNKKSLKTMKSLPNKKKMTELKPPVKDTITETISFVIKGELTPIKPTPILPKIKPVVHKMQKKKLPKPRGNIERKCVISCKKPNTNEQSNKIHTSASVSKKKPQKVKVQNSDITSGTITTKASKRLATGKTTKGIKLTAETQGNTTDESLADEIKKQKTIAKLLKEANRALRTKPLLKKLKSEKLKNDKRKKDKTIRSAIKKPKSNILLNNKETIETSSKVKVKQEVPTEKPSRIKEEPRSDTESKAKNPKTPILRTKTKMLVVKKKNAPNTKRKFKEELNRKWNGPKRHRVASLNAIAKVHCLYENETKCNILDRLETPTKNEQKKEVKDEYENSVPSQRSLRSLPGLRAVGKHWDMHDSTSSSDESTGETVAVKKPTMKKEATTKTEVKKVRRKLQPKVVMDLKDMVVRKRMASLNASAILAASYSAEKRLIKNKSDDSSYYDTDSSEEYFAASDNEEEKNKLAEVVIKKEEDKKLIEVHATPNKKVAVILNQDTDVTITGVYVNSTTRSTHHEGYCSIAGMQYRISATSHTQTAATAVSTETLLQGSSNGGTECATKDTQPAKSYTPLDALSNMQPPPGPGIQHGPHVLPMSPSLRHNCSSAFSAPHAANGHHHQSGDPGYVHGYYQPAGPLITLPHGHGQPPPPPLAKSVPVSDTSPSNTTPPGPPHQPPPAPPSSNGDSSDSEVIITSVTAGVAKEPLLAATHSPSYRYSQYPSTPPGYTYSYPPYHYAPPPSNSPYAHHDLCYPPTSYAHHKFTPYRRVLTSSYYPTSHQEVYTPTPSVAGQHSQQVVSATPASTTVAQFPPPSSSGPPPVPPLVEPYAAPPLMDPYQPPHHYYSHAYSLPPSCYNHGPNRAAVPYINAAYQSCPCPMQSCPKNVLTGPLTGDSKRSAISSISKDSMPLPPVALALPLEPSSATGPPSPARGSAGMPPPPSPAGATYQPPPAPKEESQSPETEDLKKDKKKLARVGKAMVRSNMQNTMLLMCNPNQNYVKREIESPKEKVVSQRNTDEDVKLHGEEDSEKQAVIVTGTASEEVRELKKENLTEDKEIMLTCTEQTILPVEELPCVATVAETVKVKNMKRKQFLSNEQQVVQEATVGKKQKLGSYKDFIKRETSCIKIDNGKRKLIDRSSLRSRLPKIRLKRRKRILGTKKDLNANRRLKSSSTRNNNSNCKVNKSPSGNKNKNSVVDLKQTNPKSAVKVLDSLFARNNVDRIIETVISESIRTGIKQGKCANRNKKHTEMCSGKTLNEAKKVCGRRSSKLKEPVPHAISTVPRRSLQTPRWSNGWMWEGEPYEGKVFINSDETTVIRKCYPAMRHEEGDLIVPKDCVLLKAGPRKNDLPYVAKIAYLWENPDDGEMMMSLLWYYRPEHTEQGRQPVDQPDEVFASRHKDSNSVACIDDKCYVLTFNEYCRFRKFFKRVEEGIEETLPCIPVPEPYPRSHRQPPSSQISPDMVFFCRKVYDFRQKRIMKNPT